MLYNTFKTYISTNHIEKSLFLCPKTIVLQTETENSVKINVST